MPHTNSTTNIVEFKVVSQIFVAELVFIIFDWWKFRECDSVAKTIGEICSCTDMGRDRKSCFWSHAWEEAGSDNFHVGCFFTGLCHVVATKLNCCFGGLCHDSMANPSVIAPSVIATFQAAAAVWQKPAHFPQISLLKHNEMVFSSMRRGKRSVCGHSLCPGFWYQRHFAGAETLSPPLPPFFSWNKSFKKT